MCSCKPVKLTKFNIIQAILRNGIQKKQFERTLIIADERSSIRYLKGFTALQFRKNSNVT